ncbi:uncharacterized protein isoform X2 [Rhodnius prolixus]|uniref:uncharacterized protein isoform X2 n=1 Tax=Rhodnius prolixus TaxID=13249 RepID=UPI003D188D82
MYLVRSACNYKIQVNVLVGSELPIYGPLSNHKAEKENTNKKINYDNPTESLIFDINENIYELDNINIQRDSYYINDKIILENTKQTENEMKFYDMDPSNHLTDCIYSLNTSPQALNEDPYERIIKAFVNDSHATKEYNTQLFKENKLCQDADNFTLLDISHSTEYYRTYGHWDYVDSQESDKSEYLEEDEENLILLKKTLKSGMLNSEWLNQSKKLPSSEKLLEARREAENSIIKLEIARQKQIEQESKLSYEDSFVLEEESANDSEAEVEKDRKCDEIAKYSNMIWRRPIKEKNSEILRSPVLNSPTPVQCAFVAYTPAGQKYTVNLMEGRPKKFKNVGSMMMWDISTKINTQRMIAQIEDGSFFPNTLDYEKENQFRYLLKIQKKKLLKWLAAVTWDNLESDINFLISEKEILLNDVTIKKWRPENHSSYILQFLNALDNVPIDVQVLLKNPFVLSTLFKLTVVDWRDINQKASDILEKFKMLFSVSTQEFCCSSEDCFKNQLYRYEKARGHLRQLYQKLLISSKFHHVPSIEDNLNRMEEKTGQGTLPPRLFCWN